MEPGVLQVFPPLGGAGSPRPFGYPDPANATTSTDWIQLALRPLQQPGDAPNGSNEQHYGNLRPSGDTFASWPRQASTLDMSQRASDQERMDYQDANIELRSEVNTQAASRIATHRPGHVRQKL